MVHIKKDGLIDLVKQAHFKRTQEKITIKMAESFIEDVFEAIRMALLNGYDVNIKGVGILKHKQRAPRKGYNPKLLKELKENGVSDEEAKKQSRVDIPSKNDIIIDLHKEFEEKLNS